MGATEKQRAGGPAEERNAERQRARRAQILDAATSVFAELGYHGARMDDIVRASELSKGAIYWYFKSKEEIAVELVRQRLQEGEESLTDVRGADVDPVAVLGAMTDDFARRLTEEPERAPLELELFSLGQRIPEIKRHFAAYHETYVLLLGDLLRAAAAGNATEEQIRAAALALAAMVDGWVLHKALDATPAQGEADLGRAVRALVDGLRAPTG
ncbi:TetR/AcrR family transcriptional regulator [Streptomyces hainanensis]|uniref:TetR/AcrR family transcriptional regulator n=1 Tax=Streptomyces hainanensis TaxID=402648 RepID=UPI001404E84E|nr:TetR/AcrR family transcriptional regulator [Streptomyces hainanensis]